MLWKLSTGTQITISPYYDGFEKNPELDIGPHSDVTGLITNYWQTPPDNLKPLICKCCALFNLDSVLGEED